MVIRFLAADALSLFGNAAVAGGVVVDRLGRRRTSVLADLGSAASVAALPVVDATAGLDLGWFVTLAIAGALFDVPG